jgi:uncharacterized protein (DUF983 family)
MSAFFDTRCPRCGKRFGWHGGLSDRPACPACGRSPDGAAEEAKDIEDFKEALRANERKGK